MTALYLPTGRIPFIPTRIVRAFNDNVAVSSFAADGAGAVLLDCEAAPAADFAPFHATLTSDEGQPDHGA